MIERIPKSNLKWNPLTFKVKTLLKIILQQNFINMEH